ncbi:LOW QUALITY PROTEIN: uncharacterized protein [Dendrobates tinctorius]|uniref:LOW QUALITY PROTEIN: uncharacterized protein n=1 Tax=Dendrobates tinctorius TaxID=92724 RepID=UPI003CC95774
MWEHDLIFQNNSLHKGLRLWKHFIDDILFVLDGALLDLQTFIASLNTNSYGLEFTPTYSKTSVNFLDLTICVEYNKLITKGYHKEVDSNSYIHINSCHLPVWLTNIPKSQYMRVKRNCTNTQDFHKETERLTDQIMEKGYDPQQLNQTKKEVENMSRTSLIYKSQNSDTPLNQGWHDGLKQQGKSPRRITQLQYYCYMLSVRNYFNPLLNGGKLTQQYLVDAYVKIEANRLHYIRNHQKDLKVEDYCLLQEHLLKKSVQKGIPIGKTVILPSSFEGSPRNMQQRYQDAMAIVTKYGRPDLFITMTCNPKWNEITTHLEPWQRVEHRPDLVARVFKIKLESLLKDISSGLFGNVTAMVHVIEFQKRGLPHAHILIILDSLSKLRTEADIDNIVWAEIPDETIYPQLHNIVLQHMIHGPCGEHNPNSPCMDLGKCSKGFPKQNQPYTIKEKDGYPTYRRPIGKTYEHHSKMIDNSWVVPYNPFLLTKYKCHINVEICASIQGVKYLFKYVYKGHDKANLEISAAEMKETLNQEQLFAYDVITEALQNSSLIPKCFFLDGPGVSGKTYLYHLLTHHLRGQGEIVSPAATTGIASNLIQGGRTIHSLYGIPIPINETSVSRIKNDTNAGKHLQSTKLFIIDECTMVQKHALNVIDRLLRDIMTTNVAKNKTPFGGKVIVLGGGFRQCLPVIAHGTRIDIVDSCIKYSEHWQHFTRLLLINNMRSTDPEYSTWLLKLGNAVDCGESAYRKQEQKQSTEKQDRAIMEMIVIGYTTSKNNRNTCPPWKRRLKTKIKVT